MSEQSEQHEDAVVPVTLVGGPPDWDGAVLDLYTAADLAGERDELGTMLISGYAPDRPGDEDPDPRACYSPDPDPAPASVWFFRGWFPAGVAFPDFVRPSPADRVAAAVAVDGRGVPLGWTRDGDAQPWRVERVRVHWVFDGEGQRGTDLGVWQVRAVSPQQSAHWELVHDPGAGGWSAAPLPAGGDAFPPGVVL